MPRPKLHDPNYVLRLRGRAWTLYWTDPDSGRTRAVSTRQTERRAAEVWRDQWLAGREQPAPPAEPLISDILDGYVEARRDHVESVGTLELSAATIKHLIGNLEPHMLGASMFMDRRRREKIPAAVSRNSKRPGRARQATISDGTIRREGGVLRAALAWAVQQKWVDPPEPHVDLPPMPPPREIWLTREEVGRLINGCATPHIRLFVMLAYHTAARPSAIFDLTWDRVDFRRRRIDYDRAGRRQTKKRRIAVRINDWLLVALQEAKKLKTSDYVIEYRGRPVREVYTAFAAAVKRADLPKCTPYILRHSAATHMVESGIALEEVARLLGDTKAMVERVYGHHSPDYLRAATDALAMGMGPRLVFQTLSEKPTGEQGVLPSPKAPSARSKRSKHEQRG